MKTCTMPDCSRPHHAQGLCSPCYRRSKGYPSGKPPNPSANAEAVLRRGGSLNPPRSLPYRVIARTCGGCGDLLTTPPHLLRKDTGPLPRCHACHLRAVKEVKRKREERDEEYRAKERRRTERNRARAQAETQETASRSGYQWTGPELEIIARSDLSARRAAEMLGRSMYAVKHARQRLKEPKWDRVAGLSRG